MLSWATCLFVCRNLFCFCVYISLLILQRCCWSPCRCELLGLGSFLKWQANFYKYLFIPNCIFMFYKHNILAHTSLTYFMRDSPSPWVLELKVKQISSALNHVTYTSTWNEKETLVGKAFGFYFASWRAHVNTRQTNSLKNVKNVI